MSDAEKQEMIRRLNAFERKYGINGRGEIAELRDENARLRDLVAHCLVHAGHKDFGYVQMDPEMKTLYCELAGTSRGERDEWHFQDEANARLALAASDLLEALKSFGVLACTPEWMARRDAAIAKATGEGTP